MIGMNTHRANDGMHPTLLRRGKEHDEEQLACQNYPGTENQFAGDDEI